LDDLLSSVLRLVIETSTNLPDDVRDATRRWQAREDPTTLTGRAVGIIAQNVDQALAQRAPICQDTGMPTFWVKCPASVDQSRIAAAVREAVATATRMGVLRPNSVDTLTGRNAGLNLGPGTPVLHFEQHTGHEIVMELLLKGGGCENQSAQYSLPCDLDGVGRADRDLEGVYRCVMHALHRAQGHGCSTGFIGVCIGSDRAEGYAEAKRQLLRRVDDANPVAELSALESRILEAADRLRIGAMGFGGPVTLLGCKIGALNRVPASYFVTVAYNCWAYRRLGVVLDAATGGVVRWMHLADAPEGLAASVANSRPDRVHALHTPVSKGAVRALRVGDLVTVTGPVYTARDAMHRYLLTNDAPVNLRDGMIYHCGPVMTQGADGWTVKAAGPTTSIREEPYEADVLKRTGARLVCGKGGMGSQTLGALRDLGGVYLNAIGGAAAYYADRIVAVDGVSLLDELGVPEAMWHLRVEEFPAVVTMDSHGDSLHARVEAESAAHLVAIVDEGVAGRS
jgi:fumarate hydratase class I